MPSNDYYTTLWLEKTASTEEIKKAYRKLAMQYHPDRNAWDKDAEAKFKEVNEAYGVLSDAQKRQQYDMFWNTSGAQGFWGNGGFSGGFSGFEDIFSSFFGGSFWGTQRNPQTFRWEDIEHDVEISFSESIYGGKTSITFQRRETCEKCDGAWGSEPKTCETCQWAGQVTHTQQSPFGVIQQTRVCADCQGSWEVFENTCETCHGEKRVLNKHTIDIDIPAGIDNGMVIKFSGEGNAGVWDAMPDGDLYVRFYAPSEEKWLRRDGVNLHYDISLEIPEAVLGTQKEISIPVIWKRKVTIEPGTQAESIIKKSWDGVKHISSDTKGDLLLHVHIPIPKKLSKTERALYEDLAAEKNIPVSKKKTIF